LGLAAKRTSEDFLLALEKHKSSMARVWWKSRSAKVEIGLLIELTHPVSATHRKMLRLEAERLLAFGRHFSQIGGRHWFVPILARFPPYQGRASFFPQHFCGWS